MTKKQRNRLRYYKQYLRRGGNYTIAKARALANRFA